MTTAGRNHRGARRFALPALGALAIAATIAAAWLFRTPTEVPISPPLTSMLGVWRIRVQAAIGRPQAQLLLGHAFARGFRVRQDYREAVRWFRLAADQGNISAQFILGEMSYDGRGVAANPREAVRWWERAAEGGHANACRRVSDAYARGLGVPVTPAKAVKWWGRLAAAGDVTAKKNLAWAVATGWGTERDPSRAVATWQELASKGDRESLYRLGEAYATGNGIARDAAKAVELWSKSCESDTSGWSPGCSHALCRAYADGTGVAKDPVRAARLCRRVGFDSLLGPDHPEVPEDQRNNYYTLRISEDRADAADARAVFRALLPRIETMARQGDAAAQYEFGLNQHEPEARLAWFELAAAQGHAEAKKAVDAMAANRQRTTR